MMNNPSFEEGLNNQFITVIKRDLNRVDETQFQYSPVVQTISDKFILNGSGYKHIEARYKNMDKMINEIIRILKKESINTAILHKIACLLSLKDVSASKKELMLLYQEMLAYLKEVKEMNQSILDTFSLNPTTNPNMLLAYSDFVTGIRISVGNCGKFLQQKAAISRSKSKVNKFYTVTYPDIKYSIENDRTIIEQSYDLIMNKQKSL